MLPCAIATLTSAFLLFQVQPLIARAILPGFGGSPAVWSTCMLFFQVLLVAGYGYAHLLARRSTRAQVKIHGVILLGSVAVLAIYALVWGAPLLPPPGTAAAGSPTWTILRVLAVAVGIPYVVLSTTGPLLQVWLGRLAPAASPYRLYALSNTGSLAGLLFYPLIVEPMLTLRHQALAWSGAYLLFVTATLITGARAMKTGSLAAPATGSDAPDAPPPPVRDYIKWGFFACVSSTLLLATTNQLCQDVAAIPLLWVVPLSLYLLSFVLAFDRPRWYARALWMPLFAAGVVVAMRVMPEWRLKVVWQIAAWSLLLFAGCVICHGELARSKPAPRHLTGFYLAIAVGGALGGIFVCLVAPALLREYYEVHVAIVGCALTIIWVLAADRAGPGHRGSPATTVVSIAVLFGISAWLLRQRWVPERLGSVVYVLSAVTAGLVFLWSWWRPRGRRFSADDRLWARAALPVALCGLMALLFHTPRVLAYQPRSVTRSFFGVLRVYEQFPDDPASHRRVLAHGRIVHGLQLLSEAGRRKPTTYYETDSGIGRAILLHPHRAAGLRMGVCGLGTGTIAAYAQAGDTLRFYEIDPNVIALSQLPAPEFSYLRDAPGRVDVVLGDARVSLADELRRDGSHRFDVLAVDAFSGDAIPVHLLTKEAVSLYLAQLADDGVLALHVSNKHIRLVPVVKAIARALGIAYLVVDTGYETNPKSSEWESTWMLLARSAQQLRTYGPPENDDDDSVVPPWTDEYSNIVRALNF